MYLTTGTSKHYPVLGQSITAAEVRYTLEAAPAALGETVKLWTNDGGMCLRTDAVADWQHPRIDGDVVVLTNAAPAEPEPPEPEPVAPVPTVEEDLLATALDHEARLAALELLGGES